MKLGLLSSLQETVRVGTVPWDHGACRAVNILTVFLQGSVLRHMCDLLASPSTLALFPTKTA